MVQLNLANKTRCSNYVDVQPSVVKTKKRL